MKAGMYAIFDKKMKNFREPFFAQMDKDNLIAKRIFGSILLNSNSEIAQFPNEFDLQQIGEYDDQTGDVHPWKKHAIIADGIELFKQVKIEREKFYDYGQHLREPTNT